MSDALSPYTVAVVGVSGNEQVKGSAGVGKSLLCNRFIRGNFDEFFNEHSSVLSQSDFYGPIVSGDHWLYWGERTLEGELLDRPDSVTVRVIEETEFLDDESFEAMRSPHFESYEKRCSRLHLDCSQKIMYIRQEQLGNERDYPLVRLECPRISVSAFIFVFDISRVPGRSAKQQADHAAALLLLLLKTKKPVVIAATKSDVADEETQTALAKLLSSSRLPKTASSLPVVYVSSLLSVNVDEVFALTVSGKKKLRSRHPLPFQPALRIQEQRIADITNDYVSVVSSLLDGGAWPAGSFTWKRAEAAGLCRNDYFVAFVKLFGQHAARRVFERRAAEMRDEYISSRLEALLPSLPAVFRALLEDEQIASLDWSQAKEAMECHPLFDNFFSPLGSIDHRMRQKEAEGGAAQERDQRLPAEILLFPQTAPAYRALRDEISADLRLRQLADDFQRFLAASAQVTPGRPLAETRLLLAGHPAWDTLPAPLTSLIYEKFQEALVARAEADFVECLLENVDLLVYVILARPESLMISSCLSTTSYLTPHEMNTIKQVLHDDFRYRQLSAVPQLRDAAIQRVLNLFSCSLASSCSADSACIDSLAEEHIHDFLNRRGDARESALSSDRHCLLCVHGEADLAARFMRNLQTLSRPSPLAEFYIDYVGEEEAEIVPRITHVFIIDSASSLSAARLSVSRMGWTLRQPLFVLHNDFLTEQVYELSSSLNGVVVSTSVEEGRFLEADSLAAISECLLEEEASALPVQSSPLRFCFSFHCGDRLSPGEVLFSLLPSDLFSSSWTSWPSLCLSLPEGVELQQPRILSLHSLLGRTELPGGVLAAGQVVVFSTARVASWAAARCALRRLLEQQREAAEILLVAVDREQNSPLSTVLMQEGRELAKSVGCRFAVVGRSGATEKEAAAEMATFTKALAERTPRAIPPTNSGSDEDFGGLGSFSGSCIGMKPPHSQGRHRVGAEEAESAASPLSEQQISIAAEYSTVQDGSCSSDSEKRRSSDEKSREPAGAQQSPREGKASEVGSEMKKKPRRPYGAGSATGVVAMRLTASPGREETVAASPRNDYLYYHQPLPFSSSHLSTPSTSGASSPSPAVPPQIQLQMASSRSLTIDLAAAAERRRADFATPPARHPLRQSMSSESVHKEQKKRFGFVRMVKASIRRRTQAVVLRGSVGEEERDKEEDEESSSQHNHSRSLPQSPLMVARRARREAPSTKKNTLPLLAALNGSGPEKSGTFSWLPMLSARKKEKEGAVSSSSGAPSSMSIEEVAETDGTDIPFFLSNAIALIEKEGGLLSEGIYRLSGSRAQTEELLSNLANEEALKVISPGVDVFSAAVALKTWLMQLREPLLPHSLQARLLAASSFETKAEREREMRVVLSALPTLHSRCLRLLCGHLSRVAEAEAVTAMSASNLAIVWLPSLLRPRFEDIESLTSVVDACKSVLTALFIHWQEVLPDP